MTDLKVKPLFERIFIKVDEIEKVSTSGLILPQESLDSLYKGTVIAVGHTVTEDTILVGDRVLFQKHAGFDITISGEKVRMMMINDVWAKEL
jgi:chaperonin GroES